MEVKKLQGLLLGFLLLLGISTSAMGQITAGITVRVTRPDSGRVVAIGDSVVVTVANTLSSTPDSVYIRVVPVASASDTTTAMKSAIDSTGAAQGPAATVKFSKKAVNVTASGGAPTFRSAFNIAAGDPEILVRLAVIATVYSGSGSGVQFHSLNNTATVGANPALGNVGDRKTFGVDGQRPVIANIDTVYLDANVRTTATAPVADGSGSTTNRGWLGRLASSGQRAFKAGETMGVNIVLRSQAISQVASGSLAGAVVLVDSAGIAAISDESKARARVRFLASALLSGDTTKAANDTTSSNQIATVNVAKRFPASSIARKAIVLATGQFPDNANVTAQAFLIDAAGNLSGSTAGASTATGVTASLTYLVDCVAPVFSSVYPDTTGKRFTGLRAILADTIDGAGTGKVNARFGQRPVKWSLSEAVDSLKITVGTKSWTRGYTSGTQAAGTDTFDINENLAGEIMSGTTPGTIASAGSAVNVTLAAYDNAGNSTSRTTTGAILDSTAMQFTGQFPRMINKSNKDTFNASTSAVVFTLSEAADSLRVTYRRLGVSSGTVTTARGQGGGNININLTSTAAQRIDVTSDSLRDQSFYSLQLLGRDLAYNWTITGPDTLFYNTGFKNPNADTIRVLVNSGSNDTAVVNAAGTGILLDVAAVDTLLGSIANTYGPSSVMVDVWSPDTTANLVGVHIRGTGATELTAVVTEAGRRIRRATLDNGGWVLGSRQLTISDTLSQNRIYVQLRDTARVSRRGQSQALVFEAGQMTKYRLMVPPPVVTVMDTATVNADRPFMVAVQPQDKYSNPSLKQADLIYTSSAGGNALSEIYVEFASDAADLVVPAGPQRLNSTSYYHFDLWAPNRNDQFRISVRGANVEGVSTNTTQAKAVGHLWIQTTGAGGVVAPPPGGNPAVAKPDTLIVQDYRGPDGSGDQGGFVLVTFKNAAQHAQLSNYRIWREILTSTDYDTTTQKIRSLATPRLTWVPWAVVDAVPVLKGAPPITNAVIPTLDNVATRWAITAEMGPGSSEAATSSAAGARAGKVVYSPESVKETLALLGIQSVMSDEEIAKVFSPAYEQFVLGDRKNLLIGRLDLDAMRRMMLRIPETVRAQTVANQGSDATLAAVAMRAIDNIPPAAVSGETSTSDAATRTVTLSWTASADDRIVGFMPYRGFATPIPGVRTYDVLRGATEQSLVKVASLAPGSSSFKDVVSADLGNKLIYRVTATDLDNATPGKLISVDLTPAQLGRKIYLTSNNLPVYLMLDETNPSFNLTADFDDFFAFADAFGKSKGQTGFSLQADANDDGTIGFDDFFLFADTFGRTAAQPRAGKPITQIIPQSGVNRDAELKLTLATERIISGQQIKLDVDVSNVAALKGYGFTLTYDPQKFELVEATAGDKNLLLQGGNTPVFLKNAQPGSIQIANAISGDGAVAGSGSVAQLVFNVKGEFDGSRFEIVDGVLIDGSRLLNPVVSLGVLDVQTTPKEFALRQNFPNPFNPETTIKYELAASGQVELRIYNMVGQVVRTLVSERQAAGRYSIRWDGKDGRGVSVSSGIYFYSLSADKFHTVKKLMLLK